MDPGWDQGESGETELHGRIERGVFRIDAGVAPILRVRWGGRSMNLRRGGTGAAI